MYTVNYYRYLILSTREYQFYITNWYKLEKFRPSAPRRPDAPRIQTENTELPPYLPGYTLKKYALAKKQYLGTFGYFCTRPHNLLVAAPVLIPLFRVPDMVRCISHQYSHPICLIHNIISIGTRSLFRPLKLLCSYRRELNLDLIHGTRTCRISPVIT